MFHRTLALCAVMSLFACDADEVAKECVAADLIGQCPAGSNPVLGVQASEGCDGTFDGNYVEQSGSVSGQCNAAGSCEFLCQFTVPCTCGVATLTKEAIVCSECPEQSCGDSRCEGTERAACEPNAVGCLACAEDCAGPSCGDGDCSGAESPANCPQDCAGACEPSDKSCLGTQTRVCRADGSGYDIFDCGTIGLTCAAGNCVALGVCGNLFCDVGETPASCPGDCSTTCNPNATRCSGTTLFTCNANGSAEASTDCATLSQVCVSGECRPADVCGNGLCEAGEDLDCPGDCAAECGNAVCENGEDVSCPADCVVCGDGSCGAGEISACPQDCGICVPSAQSCLGKRLRVCNANGTAYDDVDCEGFGLTCGGGDCVEADVCGNGLCDGVETSTDCPVDCGVVCGDRVCDPGETFRTCSVDCEPECGDGTCEGLEDFASCTFDCLDSCGNGACDALEDRVNCPSDCGFCGDSKCQDGAETSNMNPPANLETCVGDCVVSGCQQASDCDDGIECTEDQCVSSKCVYAPKDNLCGANDKCIKFNGCCPDADRDGFADEVCGGSDCNDDDGSTYPGAPEVCGGGDKNCSGAHIPRLTPAKRLTNTPSAKRFMKVMPVGQTLLVAWTGNPTNTNHLEMMTLDYALQAGTPMTVSEIEVADIGNVAMAFNPARNALGVMWPLPRNGDAYTTTRGGWVSLDGTLIASSVDLPYEGAGFCSNDWGWLPTGYDGIADGTEVIFAANGLNYRAGSINAPPTQTIGWYELGVTGSLTRIWGVGLCNPGPSPARGLLKLDGLITGLNEDYYNENAGGTLITVNPAETVYPSSAPLAHDSASGVCALGEDGDLLVVVCQKNGVTWYHRTTQGGGVFYSAEVQQGEITPLAVGKSRGNGPTLVGVATRDAQNNLWFFERDVDGNEVLAPAVIAGGGAISSAHVVHDGTDFQVIWLAKTGGFEQVFGQSITCE